MSSEELKTVLKEENKNKRKRVDNSSSDFNWSQQVIHSSRAKDAKPWKERKLPPIPMFSALPLSPKEALAKAIKLADIDYIKHCLSNGSSLQSLDFRPRDGKKSSFFTIVEKNKEEVALLILSDKVDFSEKHESKSVDSSVLQSCSLVDFAIKHNANKLLAKLLEAKADVHSSYVGKLWILAAYYGSDKVMKYLIAQGQCSNASNTSADISEAKVVLALEQACTQTTPQSRLEFIELLFKKHGSEKDSINDCFCVVNYLQEFCEIKGVYENTKAKIKVQKVGREFEIQKAQLKENLNVIFEDFRGLEDLLAERQHEYEKSFLGVLFTTILSQIEQVMQDLAKLGREEFPLVIAKKQKTENEEESDEEPVFKLSRAGMPP